jgi:SAM-dependent MidA family methyltransferase
MRPETALPDRIRKRIESEGPICFSDYMAMCMYDESDGYYSAGKAAIGDVAQEDDFSTHPEELSPFFGGALAVLASRISRALPGGIRRIISMGSGNGVLDYDLLQGLRLLDPELYGGLHYIALDINPSFLNRQKAILARHSVPASFVRASAVDFPFRNLEQTLIISNELIDNLPFDILQKSASGYSEIRVDCQGGLLKETSGGSLCGNAKLFLDVARAAGRTYSRGERIPANASMIRMARAIRRALGKGAMISIDNGGFAEKPIGAVKTFSSRKALASRGILADSGDKDITAVADLKILSEAAGFSTVYAGSDILTLCALSSQEALADLYGEPPPFIPFALNPRNLGWLMMIQTAGCALTQDDLAEGLESLHGKEDGSAAAMAAQIALEDILRYIRRASTEVCEIPLLDEEGPHVLLSYMNPGYTEYIEEAVVELCREGISRVAARYRPSPTQMDGQISSLVRQIAAGPPFQEIAARTFKREYILRPAGLERLLEGFLARIEQEPSVRNRLKTLPSVSSGASRPPPATPIPDRAQRRPPL